MFHSGENVHGWEPLYKDTSPTKLVWLGHVPPASQAGRLAGPVFYVYVFSLVLTVRTIDYMEGKLLVL